MRGGELPNAPKMGECDIMKPDSDVPPHEVEFANKEVMRPQGRGIITLGL